MIVVLLAITLPIILVYLLRQARKSVEKTGVPPGPPGLPLVGNLLQFRAAKSPHIYFRQLAEKYGPLIHMKVGTVPMLVVTSSRLAKEVLKIQDSAFCSRPKFIGQYTFAYNGLDIAFSPYGEYWREVKKIFSVHHVSNRKIQSFRAIREDEISHLVAKISGSAQKAVDLNEIAMSHITILIMRISCGKRFDEAEKRRFDEIFNQGRGPVAAFYLTDYFPALSWVDRLTGSISRLDAAFKRLDSFYQDLIDDHLDPKRVQKDDILDVLIQMKKDEQSSSIDVNSWDNVKALLKNILLGGIDTSAATIVWIMTSLIKTPKAMEKVQSEIRNVVGTKGMVDEDDLAKFPYLKAVVKETLRMYPPFPMLVARETITKCNLDGYEVQPEIVVYVNAFAIMRDPENWKNPDEFLPERFLNEDIDIKGQDFRALPFGSGRRICPGLFLGLANVELTAANLLYSFDWEVPAGTRAEDIDTDPLPGITMHKKNPLFLVPKKHVF